MSGVTVVDDFVAGSRGRIPVRWYRPSLGGRDTSSAPTLVWAHGGGFFKGDLDQPESHDVALALARGGMAVVTVDYGLVPVPGLRWARNWSRRWGGRQRVEFPVPQDDIFTVFQSVSGQTAGKVFLGGASAGACLAAAATLRAVDEGLAPAGVVLAYGFFHARSPRSAEIRSRVRGRRRITHAWWALDAANRNYAGSEDALADRLAFPGGHELDGFPPALVINADRDAMRASGDLFAFELTAAGTHVEHHVLAETRHAFLNRPGLEEFATAIEMIAAWSFSAPKQ